MPNPPDKPKPKENLSRPTGLVIIIEDNPDNAKTLLDFFAFDAPHLTILPVCRTAAEAQKLFSKLDPLGPPITAIVADLNLPDSQWDSIRSSKLTRIMIHALKGDIHGVTPATLLLTFSAIPLDEVKAGLNNLVFSRLGKGGHVMSFLKGEAEVMQALVSAVEENAAHFPQTNEPSLKEAQDFWSTTAVFTYDTLDTSLSAQEAIDLLWDTMGYFMENPQDPNLINIAFTAMLDGLHQLPTPPQNQTVEDLQKFVAECTSTLLQTADKHLSSHHTPQPTRTAYLNHLLNYYDYYVTTNPDADPQVICRVIRHRFLRTLEDTRVCLYDVVLNFPNGSRLRDPLHQTTKQQLNRFLNSPLPL